MTGDNEVDYEKEASALGWVPEDKFKGDPEKWVDAETFVERGKQILPLLKKNNERLQGELLTRDAEIGKLREQLASTTKIVERLETHFNEATKRQLEAHRKDLKQQLIEAKKNDDPEQEVEIQEQLDQLTEAERDAKEQEKNRQKEAKDTKDNQDQVLSPAFIKWKNDNPWYGVDKVKTKAMLRAAEDLRDEGDKTVGAEFFEKVAARAFGEGGEDPPRGKVESGNARNGNPSSTRAKGFSSLPKEAQDACMADAETFVGAGKKFKELKDWQAYYTKLYNGEQV